MSPTLMGLKYTPKLKWLVLILSFLKHIEVESQLNEFNESLHIF